MSEHDERCEVHWNDGICACSERAENAALPWRVEAPEPRTHLRKIINFFTF